MAAADPTAEPPRLLRAAEVARALQIALPTVYEISRETPERIGTVRLGRCVRFRREAIDRLVHGEG